MALLNIPTFAGLTVNGVYRGTRLQHGKPDQNGQTRQTLYCGISVERKGNYGTEEEIIELVISDAMVKQGIPAKLALLENQEVSLPFWERVWTGTKSAGVTRYLANEVTQVI